MSIPIADTPQIPISRIPLKSFPGRSFASYREDFWSDNVFPHYEPSHYVVLPWGDLPEIVTKSEKHYFRTHSGILLSVHQTGKQPEKLKRRECSTFIRFEAVKLSGGRHPKKRAAAHEQKKNPAQ